MRRRDASMLRTQRASAHLALFLCFSAANAWNAVEGRCVQAAVLGLASSRWMGVRVHAATHLVRSTRTGVIESLPVPPEQVRPSKHPLRFPLGVVTKCAISTNLSCKANFFSALCNPLKRFNQLNYVFIINIL